MPEILSDNGHSRVGSLTCFDLDQESFSIPRMYVTAPEMSAGEVLNTFHRDAPYLFLGAAFVAVGLVSAAFAVIRRKYDSLLIYFALFAAFYGLRLWIHTTLLGITVQGSPFYVRLRSGIDYVPIIFAVLFFNSLGLLTRADRIVAYAVAAISTVLALATFLFGPSSAYSVINNVIVIAALVVLVSHFLRSSPAERSSPAKADFVAIRWGLLIFACLRAVRQSHWNIVHFVAKNRALWVRSVLELFGLRSSASDFAAG